MAQKLGNERKRKKDVGMACFETNLRLQPNMKRLAPPIMAGFVPGRRSESPDDPQKIFIRFLTAYSGNGGPRVVRNSGSIVPFSLFILSFS